MDQHFMDFVTQREEEEEHQNQLADHQSLPEYPLDGVLDIDSYLPQTPFYDAPTFPDDDRVGGGMNLHQQTLHIPSFPSLHPQEYPPVSTPTKPTYYQRPGSLISERRRRGRMKEKLLALRSLVPNITKMDKASIVGDAVSYVQELKREEIRLTEEIAQLERGLQGGEEDVCETSNVRIRKQDDATREKLESNHKTIMQMVVIHTDISEFYIKISCKSEKGATVRLLGALDRLEHMIVSTSNLIDDGEHTILTFSVRVVECLEETNETALKLIMLSNFLKQGFHLIA